MRAPARVTDHVILSIASAVLVCLCAMAPVRADELANVFDQLLSNPGDPALNIRYAELVEARGDTRKALAAYERALARHPNDPQLRRGYRRVKRRLQPSVTSWTWEGGVSWESNPRQLPDNDPRKDDDVTFDTRLLLFDERTIARHRWRSIGEFRTQYQNDIDDLSDAVVSLSTGPVFELGKRSRLHVAPGAAVSWLDGDWFYRDASLTFTFETVRKGATQSVSAKVTHRETNSDFLGADGIIVDVNGRFSAYNKAMPGDALYFLPRFRYSEPSGDGPGRIFSSALLPGDFVEAGGRLIYYAPVARNRAYLGGGIGIYHRSYDQNIAFGTADREDVLLEPTAHLVIPRFVGSKFDFRIDYRFEHNDSNDSFEDFENHVVGARTVRRF